MCICLADMHTVGCTWSKESFSEYSVSKDEKNPDPPTLEVSQVSVDPVNQPADPQSAKMIWLVEMGCLGLEITSFKQIVKTNDQGMLLGDSLFFYSSHQMTE